MEDEYSPVPDNEVESENLVGEVERILGTLSSRAANVLRLAFGLGGRVPM